MSDHNLPLPLTFRAELLNRVMPCLRAGECCSLVGASGVGKSNLTRFLRRRDVQTTYWGDERTWVVLIDSHSLVFGEQPDEYIVAELMIHRLIMEAEARALSGEFMTWANDLYNRLVAQPSAHVGLRYLERLCARLCEEHGFQLIFVFDQFEDLWQTMGARFFLNLRNLRDQFKYQIAYLVMTRERLQRTRGDLQVVEAFWELFASHVYGLGVYSERDALTMLERLARRHSTTITDERRQAIMDVSGQHPGLIRAVFWALSNRVTAELNADMLLAMAPVAEECAKIWNDLTPDEQHLAHLIALGLPLHHPNAQTLAELRLKEIVIGDQPALFSPLFTAYAQQQAGRDMQGIVVDTRLRRVWVDGQLRKDSLAPLEFALLKCLAQHAGSVCSREDLLRELYKDDSYDANDERLNTVLRRLREALGEDASNPRYIITHRGVGIQLTQGRIRG